MNTWTRRHFIGTGSALVVTGLTCRPKLLNEKPNIIFILADDLGLGDLGCWGQRQLATPNIDRLAAEGMRFTDAYSGATVCAPSRCSLLTGKHMGHAAVRNNWEVYPEGQAPLLTGETTVAEVLKNVGYATGLCGKWGVGAPDSPSTPNKKGFDYFYGYTCQRHAHRYYADYLWRNNERVRIPQSPGRPIYTHNLIEQESLNFIRENRERPFFLFCAWTLPHGPYTEDNGPGLAAGRFQELPESDRVYAAMVERLDAGVGRVLTLLGELGLDNKTLVVFASDNGGETLTFGGTAGLRGVKRSLYEGGIRIPLIARWPGKITAATQSAFTTAFWDFLPTAAELAGAASPSGIDGISILPTLLGREQKPHDYLYWEHPSETRLPQAVRMGGWKAVRPALDEAVELYDLKNDPGEKINIAPKYPEVVRTIEQIMREAHTEIDIPQTDPRVWQHYQAENARLDSLLLIRRR